MAIPTFSMWLFPASCQLALAKKGKRQKNRRERVALVMELMVR
jgi:hypothetical protein